MRETIRKERITYVRARHGQHYCIIMQGRVRQQLIAFMKCNTSHLYGVEGEIWYHKTRRCAT